ncbi:hypothetical protein [uncultured Sphaerochaeta sp.]|uniref:hypothetical protein n=1 Tax=uncultured Sphaerochaeta sp. TaxID=886478 RepID=UPI002A0A6619|nr:hypothetical protein [uncultured Sphaerochaeta sp.]
MMASKSLTGDLRVHGEDYHEKTELASASAGVVGAVLDTGEGGQNGALCIKVVANGAVSIADTKKLTITVNEGDASDSLAAKLSYEVAGAKAYADKDLIFDYVLPPSILRYTSVTVTCDDDAAVGYVTIYPKYLPR